MASYKTFLFGFLFFGLVVSHLANAQVLFEEENTNTPTVAEFSSSIPSRHTRSLGPILSAKSAIAIDLDSGIILYEKNAYERLPIASLTKIMTVLVTLEGEKDIATTLTVPKEVTQIVPSKMYLKPGDQLTIEQLIYGALIHSANDAAYVLSLIYPDFIQRMNDKAYQLGLQDTHFSNPVGWDEDDNFSSAYDLMLLMQYALKKNIIYTSITQREMTIVSEKKTTYVVKNTNQLFDSFLNEVGGKTGTTDEAGPSFINIIKTPNKHRILTVLLNSQNRFQETKVLSFWVMKNYEWK